MSDRPLTGCNQVLEDNPERWLITTSLIPFDRMRGVLTETKVIETEPSLWWRSKKWQIKEDGQDLYEMCIILGTHWIGS